MAKWVVGNFKMNGTNEMVCAYGETMAALAAKSSTTNHLVVLPPLPYIAQLQKAFKDLPIQLGAQDCSIFEGQGAFTGEVSNFMLKDLGCGFVLAGHSERRHKMGETQSLVIAKVKAIQQEGLMPILCIGETKEEYDAGQTLAVLQNQLSNLPQGPMIIAYEPVWAIGTGLTASLELIEQRISEIKAMLSRTTPVLYGGSVTLDNVKDILGISNVDGVLVGGASLKPEQFYQMALS